MRRPLPLIALVLAAGATAVASAPASAAPLRAPTSLSPAAGAVVQAAPEFKWGAVKSAARYDFQVSASRNFSSLVSGRGNTGATLRTRNTASTLDRALPDGTYFWRVRGITPAGRAGRWTKPRTVVKRWDLAPQLISPVGGEVVLFPVSPLVLRWAPVTGALKYEVIVATDESLSTPAFGPRAKSVQTAGTVLTMQGTLSPGQEYHWAVTPLDARGNRGVQSKGRFVWGWDSTSQLPPVVDLDARPGVFDPLLTWTPIPGAARYEVEVNSSDVWAPGSKVCCDQQPLATSLAPLKVLGNNVYFWRVRAIDASGNVGVWNVGPPFEKIFAPGAPTVPNLTLRDENGPKDLGAGPADVANPLVTWDPVPGAASYEVRVVPFEGGGCNWTSRGSEEYDVKTATTAWTPLSGSWNGKLPGGVSFPRAANDSGKGLIDGHSYCVRVLARSDRDVKSQEIVSDWTQLRGPASQAAFVYRAPLVTPDPPSATPASSYGAPQTGSTTPRMPFFTWQPVPGARSYFVVVARDAGFTNIVDVGLTQVTAYAPRAGREPKTYPDEATSYFWAVMPAGGGNGDGVTTTPQDNAPQSFLKQSAPPAPLGPANGATIDGGQPQFRWAPAEGARSYRLQVATDASFGNLVEDVQTSSTAYTALETYPVDTALFWRVRATDETGIGLTWSPTMSFRRLLPVPALSPANPLGGTTIPLLGWSPVAGAIGYDIAVDQADGTKKDFRIPSAAFTPTTFFGTGVWSFRVRAVFPGQGPQTVTGPYTGRTPFARSIGVPSSASTEARRGRMVLKWQHAPGVRSYRVELSKTTSFERPIDSREVDGTSWAPTLDNEALRFGKVFWRVAGIDEGGNRGAFKVGSFSAGASLKVRLAGRLRRGRPSRIVLTVRDGKKVVRNATISATGAGVRNRRVKTNRKGRAVLRVTPRKGTLELKVSTTDGRFGRITRRVK